MPCPSRSLRPAALAALLCALATLNVDPARGQDDDQAIPPPGLVAEYFVGKSDKPAVIRYEATPSHLLAADQSPDLRLPAAGWRVRYQGLLDVQQPGAYRFSAEVTGRVSVVVAGILVLDVEDVQRAELGPEHELQVGYHPITIEYQPPEGDSRLKLFWQSSSFAQEPIPPFALRHSAERPAPKDTYRAGRLAVEEHSCAACHRPSESVPLSLAFATRPGPRLAKSGDRLRAAWIYEWLGDPQQHRPEAVMPKLFADDRQGEIERYAVAQFLTGGQGVVDEAPQASVEEVAAGKVLYERSGCVACHERQTLADETELPARATLAHLSEKTTAKHLAAFIHDPYTIDPAGRMPKVGLDEKQCAAVAAYLMARDPQSEQALPRSPSADELASALAALVPDANGRAELEQLDERQRLDALARHAIHARRCANCHDLGDATDLLLQPRPADNDFAAICSENGIGCLANSDETSTTSPRFGASLDRAATVDFLAQARQAPGTPAPAEELHLALARFNCTACHERNATGGLSDTLHRLLTENQTAAEAELVRPPALTGITAKLRGEQLRAVLVEGTRSRPWMALKMPHFPPEHAERLPALLAAADGDSLQTASPEITAESELTEAGRMLVGSQGFGCIKCHDIRGIASGGTRGPDLAQMTQRVNFDWYLRWMADPQRIEPGARMPTVFFGGQSPHKNILDGDPHRQSVAIWHYLSVGNDLQLPDGLEGGDTKQTVEGAQPLVMRTFLPDVSPRALAVRFPNDLHLACDTQSCRLAYAWQGGFLDMAPVWTGRGGRPAGLQGSIIWRSPAGFPWAVTELESAAPDFSARATDVALGAQPPDDGKVYASRLRFQGYRSSAAGPTLRYRLQLDEGREARFEETARSLVTPAAVGIARQFAIAAPAGAALWMRVAEGDQPPEAVEPGGAAQALDGQQPIAGSTAIVVRDAEQALVIRLVESAGAEATWRTVESAGRWSLLLRMTVAEEPSVALQLVLLKPTDNQAESIAQLLQDYETSAAQ